MSSSTLVTSVTVLLIISVVANVSVGEKVGTGARCIIQSRRCTERRLHSYPIEYRALQMDALYFYCLDLFGCQEGKEQMCRNVGRSEAEYPDPRVRRQLIKYCGIWKIGVQLARAGEPPSHYVNFGNTPI